jgi:hypothetical protein
MRRAEKAHRITEEVRLIRLQQPRLGTRKLQHILNEREDAALHIGRDSLFAVLRGKPGYWFIRQGLIIKQRTAVIIFTGIRIC